MPNIELLEKSMPVAPIRIAALEGCRELAEEVDRKLVKFRKELVEKKGLDNIPQGYSEDSFTPSEFELTDYLKDGQNKLAAQVFKWTSSSWCEDQDFFRFSGIYREEEFWKNRQVSWIELQDVCGTNCYCDEEAIAEINKRTENYPTAGIHFIDSGNYHYMSKLLLGLEKEDLFLAVFDHHTDMQPPALLPVLSCGSWIRDAAGAYQNIKGIGVIVIVAYEKNTI